MSNRLSGIELWDGRRSRGPCTLTWTGRGKDSVVETVEPAGARNAGLSIIPGLIDTHVHLIGYAGDGRGDFITWPLMTRPEEQVLHGLANARRALRAGITTIRDMSADEIQFSLARALSDGIVDGPRLLAYGMVGMTAGHADLFIPPSAPVRRPTADGPDACRSLVRRWARAGADGIKICTSGGVLSVGDRSEWRNYSPAEIAAIVDEAHALRLKVAAHAHTEAGIDSCLDHGVDSIEHGTLLTAEQATVIADRGLTIAPTLLINDRIARGEAGVSAEQSEKAQDLVRRRNDRMRAAADAGVRFVLGTDANGHHVDFGDQHAEVRTMTSVLGYTAARALQAATSDAADAIGRPDLGRLQPGSPADFVMIKGRPWQDIDALRIENIVAVVSRGRVVAGELPPEPHDL